MVDETLQIGAARRDRRPIHSTVQIRNNSRFTLDSSLLSSSFPLLSRVTLFPICSPPHFSLHICEALTISPTAFSPLQTATQYNTYNAPDFAHVPDSKKSNLKQLIPACFVSSPHSSPMVLVRDGILPVSFAKVKRKLSSIILSFISRTKDLLIRLENLQLTCFILTTA